MKFWRLLALAICIPVMSSAFASHAEAKAKVLVSVAKPGATDEWARQTCADLYEIFQVAYDSATEIHCDWNRTDEMIPSRLKALRSSASFDYYLNYREANGEIALRWVNWNPLDEVDFDKASPSLKIDSEVKVNLRKRIGNWLAYHDAKKPLRRAIVFDALKAEPGSALAKKAVAQAQALSPGVNDPYVDDETVRSFIKENNRNKIFLKASIELLVVLGGSTVNYYVQKAENLPDWDFNGFGDSISAKTSSRGIRFDDNKFEPTNWRHTYAGFTYALVCRSAGMTSYESLLCSLAASAAWEMISEYHEVLSINDMVATGVGGFVLSEAFTQIGRLFARPGDSIPKRTLSAVFGSPYKFQNWVDRQFRDGKPLAKDWGAYGLDEKVFGHFEVYAGTDKVHRGAGGGTTQKTVGLRSEVTSIPMYDSPGQVRRLFLDTAYASTKIEQIKGGLYDEFILATSVMLAAWHEKNLVEDARGNLHGYNFFIGPSSAVSMYSKTPTDGNREDRDFNGTFHVIGSSAHLDLHSGGWRVRAIVDIYADFAMVRSFVIDQYKAETGVVGLPSVLARNDYYYAVGSTSRAQVIIEYGRWSAEFTARHQDVSSVNSHYRDQEQITRNPELEDRTDEIEAAIRYQITPQWHFRLSTARIQRKGDIRGFGSRTQTERRTSAQLVYRF